ncbi:hypothetical protein PUNSTDRAFT_40420, partial [Punctularia strigosozonata HHB-11173 SS5]
CNCSSIAHQLVLEGLFPCAPLRPTLAVDIKLLEFTRILFLHLAPNVTAWTATLEFFLEGRGYKLRELIQNFQDTLRRRYGNALKWFTHL